MGIELMVSIWPTVDKRNPPLPGDAGEGAASSAPTGACGWPWSSRAAPIHYDATNPAARDYVWGIAKENYYDKGVRIFWLDEAEPEYTAYDFDNYRYYLGPNTKVGNSYPLFYAKTFFDGMQAQGQENIINLLRCAWAGSQKYGALVWSGDIHSSFESFRNQFAAGLNMGIAGIPWWTTDIGGFHGGDPTDPAFQELLARWFQYGAFCPVMRLHGDRYPTQPQQGTTGGATCLSGAPNEVWCFGEEDYEICKKYMFLRERLRPYIKEQMAAAHEKGTPVMRPLFYDFPADSAAWGLRGRLPLWPQPAGGPGDGGGPAPAQRVPARRRPVDPRVERRNLRGRPDRHRSRAPGGDSRVHPGEGFAAAVRGRKVKCGVPPLSIRALGRRLQRRACAGEKRTCAPRAERSERKVFW